jgi:hypothetical protein
MAGGSLAVEAHRRFRSVHFEDASKRKSNMKRLFLGLAVVSLNCGEGLGDESLETVDVAIQDGEAVVASELQSSYKIGNWWDNPSNVARKRFARANQWPGLEAQIKAESKMYSGGTGASNQSYSEFTLKNGEGTFAAKWYLRVNRSTGEVEEPADHYSTHDVVAVNDKGIVWGKGEAVAVGTSVSGDIEMKKSTDGSLLKGQARTALAQDYSQITLPTTKTCPKKTFSNVIRLKHVQAFNNSSCGSGGKMNYRTDLYLEKNLGIVRRDYYASRCSSGAFLWEDSGWQLQHYSVVDHYKPKESDTWRCR